MGRYVARRLVALIPTLFGVSFIVFMFLRLIPGDPATAILRENTTSRRGSIIDYGRDVFTRVAYGARTSLRVGVVAVGIVAVPAYARITRASAISLREQDFVLAARAVGVPEARILARHVVPNALSPIIVQSTLGVATAILNAAALGFLGLGAVPPDVEWGAMLVDSIRFLFQGSWWALLFPGFAIMLTVIGFNLIGDGLRDSLDVRIRG